MDSKTERTLERIAKALESIAKDLHKVTATPKVTLNEGTGSKRPSHADSVKDAWPNELIFDASLIGDNLPSAVRNVAR